MISIASPRGALRGAATALMLCHRCYAVGANTRFARTALRRCRALLCGGGEHEVRPYGVAPLHGHAPAALR